MADEYIRRAEALEITTRTCGDYAAAFAEIRKLPAADVAPVVRGKPITKIREVTITEYHEARGVFASDGSNVYIKNMVHAKVPYDHCPVCGAVLCSRWHNYCGKCGAKMDGGKDNG
jgi:hypothetical protein|nr:MAG TPA: zinc-ribbon containing domain protein [Caudoviricetes sp.]